MTSEQANDLRAKAEIAIEKILNNLVNDVGTRLSHVEVDTHNFANCNTEIFFEGE